MNQSNKSQKKEHKRVMVTMKCPQCRAPLYVSLSPPEFRRQKKRFAKMGLEITLCDARVPLKA